MLFRGSTALNLDAKGRMALPARYREGVRDCCDGQMVVTIPIHNSKEDEGRCLVLYTLPHWEVIEQQIDGLSYTKSHQEVRRIVLGNAAEVDMDSKGRIMLPAVLRGYAGLNKEGGDDGDNKIMLIGLGRKFEIWAEDRWKLRQEAFLNQFDMAEMSEELQSLPM